MVREQHAELDEAQFIDAVSRSLRRGDLLLLIAGDGIRENVGAITNFIEDHGTLHFTFGLVEMAIYQMPDGSHLVQPRVLAHSEVIRRIVVDVRDGQIDQTQADAANDEVESMPHQDLEQQRQKFSTFWKEWMEKYPLDDQSQPIKKPTTWTNQFFDMPKGSGGRMAAVAGDMSGTVGVYLVFPRQQLGDQIYDSFLADKTWIEQEIGQQLLWNRDDKNQSIAVWHKFGDRLLPQYRAEAQKWLGDVVNRFVNTFRPRIESLLREE